MTVPPGKFGLPFIGETIEFFSDPNFAAKRHQEYGPIFKTKLLGQPTVFLSGLNGNKFVLGNENTLFEASWPTSTRKLLGPYSVSTQMGEVHRSRRKILAQAFMPRALAGYIPSMMAKVKHYCDQWEQTQSFSWYPELRNLTLDIACELFVGIEEGSRRSLGHNFETWVQGLFSIPLPLPWTVFGKSLKARTALLVEIGEIIQQRKSQTANSSDTPKDALSLLINAKDENGNTLSDTELQDQILTLLFAGHETLTSNMTSFCQQMAMHPEVFTCLREEVDQFSGQPLTLERLKEMSYLEKVLQEVMRFTPPVGGGFRKIIKECQFEEFTFPEGWQVIYEINTTHEDPELYPEAEKFNPDRFETDTLTAISKYGFLPFGGGFRECIGKEFARLEIKLFAIYLIENYEWQLEPNQDLSPAIAPTPYPKDGLKVTFQKRGHKG